MVRSNYKHEVVIKEDVNQCPLCSSHEQSFLFKDFEGSGFVRCMECGLVFQNPRMILDYEKDYWSMSKDPDGKLRDLMSNEERKFKVKNRYLKEIKYVNSMPGGNILDAGCGPGFFLAELNDNWNKYGIEKSQYNVDYIKKIFPMINVDIGLLENMPYNNDYFDIVYCFQVIEHIQNPVQIIKEIGRVCKSDGIIIISTPNIESFCAKRFKGNYRLLGAPHIIMWSHKTIKQLLDIIGFKVFKERYPYFKTDYFTLKNIIRLFNTKKISPPFYGNEMSLYAKRLV